MNQQIIDRLRRIPSAAKTRAGAYRAMMTVVKDRGIALRNQGWTSYLAPTEGDFYGTRAYRTRETTRTEYYAEHHEQRMRLRADCAAMILGYSPRYDLEFRQIQLGDMVRKSIELRAKIRAEANLQRMIPLRIIEGSQPPKDRGNGYSYRWGGRWKTARGSYQPSDRRVEVGSNWLAARIPQPAQRQITIPRDPGQPKLCHPPDHRAVQAAITLGTFEPLAERINNVKETTLQLWPDGTRMWRSADGPHRYGAPAVLWSDGYREWWEHGKRIR